jgi:dihydrofolate reductase
MNAIVITDRKWAIGRDNNLLFPSFREDRKRFRAITTGGTVLVGRKALESFPGGRPLSNRRNIVLSRQDIEFPGAERFASLEAALAACRADEEVYIIGGASVYQEALPLADKLCITHIDDMPAQADAFFPEIDPAVWEVTYCEAHATDEKHSFPYRFIDYQRVQ